MYFKKLVSISVMALFVASCVNPATNSASGGQKYTAQQMIEKEKFLESSNDYRGLISLYRDILKQREDDTVRYKLAESYYLVGDSKSSNFYLQPLNNKTGGKLINDVQLLQIKNISS